MIQIKRNNKVFFTLEDFGEGSKLSYQLMDHHYIILKFSTATPVYFEIGDSVEIPDFGYFELTSAYFPKHNESDGYDYEMQMDAYYMSWKNKLCKYRPQHGANETSFKLTTTVGVHMNVILGNLKALGLTYNGKDFSVDYTTYNNNAFDVQKRFLIEYGSISILDALNAICSEDALNCEWWIDGSIIYLGYCEMEGQTTFEQGVNVLSMSYSESKSTYITRLYAFGSDRNIPKGYFTGADADVTTDGVATDYLMLPNKEVDSDGFYAKDGYLENVNVVKNDKQAIEGVVMFEDEYPKVKSEVSSIKTYDSTVDNEDGTKTTQTFWQVTSTDSFTNSFKESWIKSNLTLGIKFTSGALMGMEFDVNFKVIDKVNYFEIVANDTYGRTLPDGVMCPEIGNKFFLYNWDATKITDTDLIPAAQLSLFDRAKQYYLKTMISNSNFTCTMDGDKFYNGGTYDYHPLGEQVKLIHEMFPQMDSDGNHYRNSRIIGMDIKLDIPYDKPEYVVGEKAATSRLGKLEEKVDSITVNGLKIDGSAGVGGSVYVIGVNDMTPETDSNVYSARRTKKNLADIDKKFLRKDQKDVAHELITFLKGIKTAGIENDGNNITKGLTKLYDAIMSHGFKNSMTAGSGWQIDKNGNAQVESIEVRSYMRVLELVMNRLSAEESEFVFTESGTVETATLNEDGTYTLVMRKKTDKDITAFQVDDVLKGVVNDLAESGAVGVKYYTSWVQVKEVNQTDNSIKVAVYADEDTPAKKNFNPCDLMVLHRWGNADEAKTERQSCWYISSIEKRIVMLDSVTKPILEESNYASFYGLPFEMGNFKGYDLNPDQPYLYVRGAFLQDVCLIDYLGKVVKQERYRGVWSQEVANSDDPYVVTQTTFDTVYHNNAKWQCNSTEGTKEEPSVGTTDWTKLSEGGKGSDGKSAAKAYVTSNDIAIPTDANGIVTEDFQIGNTFSLKVDGKNCTDLQVTMDGTPATDAFKAQLNQLWLTITSSKGAEFGSHAYTLHFTVKGVLDNVTYSDVVTILVRPNRAGAPGRNLTKVVNFYRWEASGTQAPSDGYTKDNIPPHTDGLDYLWNYEVCYSDNDVLSQSDKSCIGYFPKDGDPGRGIKSITEYYQVGTERKPTNGITVNSNNELDTTGWKTTMDPTTNENRFVWNQEVIQFTDGTYSISVIHLAGAQGDQGIKGDKGEDAKNLSLRCDRQVINCDEASNPWDDGNITIEAVLENLSGTVTWSIDWDNASGEEIEDTRYEIRGNVLEITDTYYFTASCYNIYITARLGQYSAKTTIVVVNDGANGKNGTNGKPLVGPTEWSKDVRYLSGKSYEAYQSLVINPKYPKQMYLCGYTHTNVEPSASTSVSSVNSCRPDKPWVSVAYQDFVATKVLFAERGKIENLDITNATIQGTITDMAVKTEAEWDAITNALVPNADKGLTEYERNFQIVDPSKAGSYFIPTIDPTSSNNGATVYERGPQIVFLPTYNPSTDYDIITSKITTSNTGKKRYNIPQYQIAGTHIRITKGGASRQYLRWAYIEDAEYDSLWNRNNGSNRNTIRDIYNMGTLICADHKIFKVTDGNDEHGHEITGAWYYGDSDYKHGRLSVNGTVARMLWLMPGQTVELVSQIEEIYNKKCLVWSVVNSSDFTAVNVNVDLYNRSSTYEPIKFHGESGILDPALAGNANNWEDCFMAHRKIDNLLLGGVTKELPRLFINRNGSTYDNGNPIAIFYIP